MFVQPNYWHSPRNKMLSQDLLLFPKPVCRSSQGKAKRKRRSAISVRYFNCAAGWSRVVFYIFGSVLFWGFSGQQASVKAERSHCSFRWSLRNGPKTSCPVWPSTPRRSRVKYSWLGKIVWKCHTVITLFMNFLRFLEGDENEDTCTISQQDITDAVDITSGTKVSNLVSQFWPVVHSCD